jgi:hypothetical protein
VTEELFNIIKLGIWLIMLAVTVAAFRQRGGS